MFDRMPTDMLSLSRHSINIQPISVNCDLTVFPYRFLQDGHGDPTGALVEPEVQARAAILRHDHRPPLRHSRPRNRVSGFSAYTNKKNSV